MFKWFSQFFKKKQAKTPNLAEKVITSPHYGLRTGYQAKPARIAAIDATSYRSAVTPPPPKRVIVEHAPAPLQHSGYDPMTDISNPLNPLSPLHPSHVAAAVEMGRAQAHAQAEVPRYTEADTRVEYSMTPVAPVAYEAPARTYDPAPSYDPPASSSYDYSSSYDSGSSSCDGGGCGGGCD